MATWNGWWLCETVFVRLEVVTQDAEDNRYCSRPTVVSILSHVTYESGRDYDRIQTPHLLPIDLYNSRRLVQHVSPSKKRGKVAPHTIATPFIPSYIWTFIASATSDVRAEKPCGSKVVVEQTDKVMVGMETYECHPSRRKTNGLVAFTEQGDMMLIDCQSCILVREYHIDEVGLRDVPKI